MDQIIVTHKNGTTLKLQSKSNVSRIARCTQTVELLGQDVVDITVESAKKLTFLLGDKITIIGRDYTLNTPATERKLSEAQFVYDLQFEGVQYDMLRASYSVNVDTTSNQIQDINGESLTGDLKRFLDVLISNLNRVFPYKWTLGTYPPSTEIRTETFSDTDNCLSVLQSLCSEDKYNTEFKIAIAANGNRTLNVGASGTTHANTFEYGKGKGIYELTRQKVSSSNIVTRLNVFGSSKNIMTSKYRAFKLCLPTKNKAQSYLENSTAITKYGVWEGTKNFEDIFPHRIGVVSALGDNELKFFDNTMDFDLNAKDGNGNSLYLIAGTSAKIHFNTGNLAGYEFEIASYNNTTKEFVLLPVTDENGYAFPSSASAAFQFAANNEYTITDIYMPSSYITTAENALQTAGQAYLAKYSQPLVSYGLTLDSNFLRDVVGAEVESNIIWAGDYFKIKDTDLDVDKTIRVKGFTRDLLQDYSYSLTIADLAITVSNVTKIITELNGIDNVIKYNNLNDPARARRNYKATAELVTMIETVQAEAILVGNDPAAQFDLTGVAIRANYNKNANTIVFSEGIIIHNYYPIGSPGTWTISEGNFASLTPATAYYVYIKASKTEETAVFYLSSTKIAVEAVSGYYHFPLGLLSSVIDGARVFTSTKGYTLITGDSIKTGRISSNDGAKYFDLTTGEFRGTFKFTNGTSIDTAITDAQTAAILASLEYGYGRNIFPQSEFGSGIEDWTYGNSFSALQVVSKGVNLNSDYTLGGNTNVSNNQGLNTAYLQHGVWVDADDDYSYLRSQLINGIQGGKKYIASIYAANHRAILVEFYMNFYDSNGTYLANTYGQATSRCARDEAGGGKDINGYKRIYAVTTAPQTATSAEIILRKYGTYDDSSYLDSFAFFCRPMLEQVATQTNKPGNWTPYASINTAFEVGNGTNMFPNAELQNGILDWAYGYTHANVDVGSKGVNMSTDWALNGNQDIRNTQGLNTIYMINGGWVNLPTDYAYLDSAIIKGIQGGKKYIASAYLGNHRSLKCDISILFYDVNGSFLNQYKEQSTSSVASNEFLGGKSLNSYKRVYVAGVANDAAVSAKIRIRKYGTIENQATSYIFFCRPMFEQVAWQTTKPGNWTPYASGSDISSLAYLKTALAQSTEIIGGLVLGAALCARDVDGYVRAYINGLTQKPYAVAAGVTNWGTGSEAARSWLDFLGNAKFGNLRIGIGGDGTTWIEDATGVTRFEFSVKSIPTLASLLAASGQDDTVTNLDISEYDTSDQTTTLPNSIYVENSSSELTISGTLQVEAEVSNFSENNAAQITATLILYDSTNQANYAELVQISAVVDRTLIENQSTTFSVKLVGVPAGSYSLKLVRNVYLAGTGTCYVNLSETTMRAQFTIDNRAMLFGSDGISLFWDAYKHFHIKNGAVTYRGTWDVPSGLGGASISSVGGISANWGNIAGTEQVSKSGNNYTITHNIGDTDYSIILTPISTNVPYFSSKSSNTIVVTCAGGFDFILIRTK